MSDFSIRAFDQAQRRKMYPDRKGPVGMACMQRDLLAAQRSLSEVGAILWRAGMMPNGSPIIVDAATNPNSMKTLQDHIADAGLTLLQLTGALGVDFVDLLRHRLEKEELTVL